MLRGKTPYLIKYALKWTFRRCKLDGTTAVGGLIRSVTPLPRGVRSSVPALTGKRKLVVLEKKKKVTMVHGQ